MKNFLIKTIWNINTGSLPVFVSGSPRSGTTWIMEVLERATASRIHWEPLNWYLYQQGHSRFAGEQYALRPDAELLAEDEAYSRELKRVLSGGSPIVASSAKIAKLSTLDNMARIFTANNTIIKFVFAQRALSWIAENSENNGCVILRHPAAIVASQLHHPYKRNGEITPHPEWTKEVIEKTHPIYTEMDLKRFPTLKNVLAMELSSAGRLAVTACLDLLNALHSETARDNYTYVVYESLIKQPGKFEQLIESLGLQIKHNLSLADIEERSRTTSLQSKKSPKGTQRLSEVERVEITSIMKNLGIDYYNHEMEFVEAGLKGMNFSKLIS
ncbi:sulfotransferase domain-containing protein [Aestuariibacter sp. A3R04]|uniref:sulfotransferase domain-containing protein n=1 Tax=Aestuariibacter sp. A3R04 TaxID=2841571 RepID=UPI001C07FE96|nr:sulfotransferase domain-containing protein [Aestuariibacter sp. A3R04]MBU3023749.1 sulfotransferase [Aestuariibacter sp. A3R04]